MVDNLFPLLRRFFTRDILVLIDDFLLWLRNFLLYINIEFVESCSELGDDLFVGNRMELDRASWVSLDFEGINYREWKSIFMELLAEACTASKNLPIFSLPLHAIRASFFDIDDHVGRVELVYIEVEKFIYELCNRFGVLFLRHIELLDHFQIFFKKGICLVHAIYLFVDVLGRMVVTSPFRIQFLDTNWIVHSLLPLVP